MANQINLNLPASTTDNTIARFSGTGGRTFEGSGVTISDTDVVGGITQLNVDNLRLDTNSISSTDTDGAITIEPDGTGAINLNSATVSVETNIVHAGDTNNLIAFGTDTQDYQTGGASRLDISDTGVRLGGANSRVTTILDEDNMASDSDTALATQQSIKAYVDSHVSDLAVVDNTSTSVTMAVNTKYINTSTADAQVTYTVPGTAAVGDTFVILGKATGGWVIQMNTGQTLNVGASATSSAGTATSSGTFDRIQITCITANTTFIAEGVLSSDVALT